MQWLLALALVGSAPAYASVVFTLGNHPQPGEQNIALQYDPVNRDFFGYDLNGDRVFVEMGLGSTTTPIPTGVTTQVAVGVTDQSRSQFFTLGDIIIDPLNVVGPLQVSVASYTSGVTSGYPTTWFAWNGGPGDNYLTITTNDRTRIESVLLYGNFNSLGDLGMSDIEAPTPEPTTLVLVGAGLVAAAWRLRKQP